MAKERKRFRVEFSTALGYEHSWDIDAVDAKEAEQIVRRRIRVGRIHRRKNLVHLGIGTEDPLHKLFKRKHHDPTFTGVVSAASQTLLNQKDCYRCEHCD